MFKPSLDFDLVPHKMEEGEANAPCWIPHLFLTASASFSSKVCRSYISLMQALLA